MHPVRARLESCSEEKMANLAKLLDVVMIDRAVGIVPACGPMSRSTFVMDWSLRWFLARVL